MSSPQFEPAIVGRPGLSLVLLAGLTLFLELAFIRWASANVIYLGYFSNFVLMACFLGIGLGFLLTSRKTNLLLYAAPLLGAVCFIVFILQTSITLSPEGITGAVYFNTGAILESPAPPWITLPLMFVGIAATFACISQATGRCFAYFTPIRAYTLDIAGSLGGIALFTLLAFGWTPAWVWFAIGAIGFVFLTKSAPRTFRLATLAGSIIATGIVALSDADPPDSEVTQDIVWSPYQRLSIQMDDSGDYGFIMANRVPHQEMSADDKLAVRDVPYDIAREVGKPIRDVLIIGAGSGTDVAEALRQGVESVTAVEIDPAIADIGKQRHPARPYDDPRVEVHINDGRAFLERTDRQWDLIIFALPDSLALYSGYSSLRLESFLFTEEAIDLAHRHLKPDGILALYNDYRTKLVVTKLGQLLHDAFGKPPIARLSDPTVSNVQMLIAGAGLDGIASDATLPTVERDVLPTDDWPFVYLDERRMPSIYWVLIVSILALTAVSVLVLAPRGTLRTMQWPFFFMGAAFLLLETKSIIQFSLLFGTTWIVNAMVFAGVLVMVLLANLLVSKFEIRRMGPFYVLLALLLLANYLIPISSLAGLSEGVRYAAATALMLAPIFAANVIFSGTFASSTESSSSFGWNILGTMVGGTAENFSLIIGYHNLAIVVAVLYLAAFATDRIRRNRGHAA